MEDKKSGFIGHVVQYFINSKLTPLIIIASILVGVFAVFNLSREEEPQISVPMFDIFVSFPGASVEEVEERIVNLGERKFWEIPGVEYVYSTSKTDGALFIVRFKVGENVEKSLINLYTKVYSNLDFLPQGATQPLIKVRSIDDVPVLAFTFHSTKPNPVALRKTVAHVQTIINTIPDVSETVLIGGKKRQYKVLFDEIKLKERLLSPLELAQLIKDGNIKLPAGHLEEKSRWISVEADGFIRTKQDLENLVVGISGGNIVYLKDVAAIEDGPDEEDRNVSIRLNPQNNNENHGPFEAVTLSISKRKGTNATALCQTILNKMETLKGSVIPDDTQYTVTRNYGETASEKSNELLLHMGIAVIGVAVLIALSLGFREALVVAIAIPMTLGLTLATFYFLGFTLNRITLFALIFSIGILVDDPIVNLENIVRHLRMQANKARPLIDVSVEAVKEVISPLMLATFTVIAAILPMAFVRGLMGPYMRPIPIGASAAMIFSMIVSFVATPWASYKILGRAHFKNTPHHSTHQDQEDLLTRIYRFYMKPLIYNKWIRWIFITLMIILLCGTVALIPLKLVKVKMLPFDNKNEFQVVLNMPEGTPLEKTKAVMEEIANYLETIPEVKDIETYVGTSSPYNFNGLVRHYYLRNLPNQADLQVNLVGKHDRHRQSHEIAQSIRPKVHEIVEKAGGHVQVAEVPPGPPVLSTLVLEVYGPSLEGQRTLTKDLMNLLQKTDGITDVDSYVEANESLSRLKIDSEKASLNGISVSTIAKTISAALAGQVVDLAHVDNEYEPLEILIRFPEPKREKLDSLLNLELLSRFGKSIPIKDLIQLEEKNKDKSIYHKNLMRVSYVIADVAGQFESPVYAIMNLKDQIQKIQAPNSRESRIEQFFTHQPDRSDQWSIKWDGEWQITYEVFRDLGLAFGAVLILIYMLVVGWFKSFKTPIIIMLPIPLTLIGILPAHWLSNVFFTATSMIGLIAGAGIVVRNAIILVDFTELRLSHGLSLEEAVIDAGAKRFRPMLLTAAAVVVGASVILFDPIFQGLALSLMAGEIASTLLSRTAVPIFYYMAMKSKKYT